MPNVINQSMVTEYRNRLGDGPDLVAVDINELTVAEVSELRNQAREKDIDIFVVKTSLARLALREVVEENGVETVVTGPTALLLGGEGMPDVARLVYDFGKKTGKLTVRGGVYEKKVLPPDDVSKFKDIPDRPTLLSQVLATVIAPLTGVLGAANSLLTAPAALSDALAKKQGEDG